MENLLKLLVEVGGKGDQKKKLLVDCWLLQWLRGKESACTARNSGDMDSIPGSGRSHGEENGNPLQYSCLEDLKDREAWWATVHEVTKSWTQLSTLLMAK